MKKSLSLMLLFAALSCALSAAAQTAPPSPAPTSAFALAAPRTLRPFEEIALTVTAPESGTLTVQVSDARGVELPVAEGLRVKQGETAIPYAATSYGGMPLKAGACTLTAVLRGDGGAVYDAVASAVVGDAIPTLEYALPAGDTVYQDSVWFMDCSVTGAGTVNFEAYTDEAMTRLAAAVRKKLAGSGIFRVTWKGRLDGRALPEGVYYCKAYLSGRVDCAFTFPLALKRGKAPKAELAPTGALLPASLGEASVWEALQKPLVVVNIEATKHQSLYAEPNGGSEPVGSVHGQSQGLEVVTVGERYTLVRAWRHEDGAPVEGYVPTKKLKVVTPSARYGVLIDKRAQRLTVYERGKVVGQMRVSTGLPAEGKAFRETRAGAFITTDRLIPFESKGYRYDYPIRIDGGNLIHQTGYAVNGEGGSREQLAQLGRKASEGCVRADFRVDGECALNAYWLWTHLAWGTKVIVTE